MWPEIFGRTHTEYFENIPQPPVTNTLPINSMSPTSLLQAIAVPHIKSLEGFQNESLTAQQALAMPISEFNDGNGTANDNQTWNGGVGNGYGSDRAAATLSFSMGPMAGTGAGAGPLLLSKPAPVVADTSATAPRQIPALPNVISEPAFSTTGTVVLETGSIPIGDVEVTAAAREENTSTPDFTVSASLVDQTAINKLKTNLASMGNYTVNVTSNIPGVEYSFPLLKISDVTDLNNKTYAFRFINPTLSKEGPKFFGAETLNFQVVETSPLPTNAPNAIPNGVAPLPTPVISGTKFTAASCGNLGYPSVDNARRLYSKEDCGTLTGIWKPNGDCAFNQDESWNELCKSLNPQSPSVLPPNTMIQTPYLDIGDVGTGPFIAEVQTSYPMFTVNATIIDPEIIEKLKTNIASSGQYTVIVTSDVPGLTYKFPLLHVTDSINPATNQTFAYTFSNETIHKTESFQRAKNLSLEVVQTAALPTTAPNAQLVTYNEPNFTALNTLSSQPPSTMNSILPAAATVSPTNNYQFANQSSMVDAHSLAEKIRSAEIMIKSTSSTAGASVVRPVPTIRTATMISDVLTKGAAMPPASGFTITDDLARKIMEEQMAYIKSQGYDLTKPDKRPTEVQMKALEAGMLTNLLSKKLIPAGLTTDQLKTAFDVYQKQQMMDRMVNQIKEQVKSGRGVICPVNDEDLSPSSPNYASIKASAAAGCTMQNSKGETIIIK